MGSLGFESAAALRILLRVPGARRTFRTFTRGFFLGIFRAHSWRLVVLLVGLIALFPSYLLRSACSGGHILVDISVGSAITS